MKVYLLLLVSIICMSLNAQNKCGAKEYTNYLIKQNPQYGIEKEKVNLETKNWIANRSQQRKSNIITIPVVIHVIWETNVQNISDAQIFSQIDVLNADYRRTNIDQINTPSIWGSIAADCEIEFCLAAIDPMDSQPLE